MVMITASSICSTGISIFIRFFIILATLVLVITYLAENSDLNLAVDSPTANIVIKAVDPAAIMFSLKVRNEDEKREFSSTVMSEITLFYEFAGYVIALPALK